MLFSLSLCLFLFTSLDICKVNLHKDVIFVRVGKNDCMENELIERGREREKKENPQIKRKAKAKTKPGHLMNKTTHTPSEN